MWIGAGRLGGRLGGRRTGGSEKGGENFFKTFLYRCARRDPLPTVIGEGQPIIHSQHEEEEERAPGLASAGVLDPGPSTDAHGVCGTESTVAELARERESREAHRNEHE